MNDLSPRRVVVMGKNSELSSTAVQDAATDLQADELFNGAYYTQHAHDLFVQARAVRHDPHMRDHYHKLAMAELDKLAEALALELVPREDVRTR